MKRRKDAKGRALKEGECQRKDGRYQYRWTDRRGARRYIYAGTLSELREAECGIQKNILLHRTTDTPDITMRDVVDQYFEVHKSSLRADTRTNQEYLLGRFKDDPFWSLPANCITVRDAKMWVKKLEGWGWAYQTINGLLAIVRPAFDAACEDELIFRNPFSFSLSKVMSNKRKPKQPLTEQQYEKLLDFVRADARYRAQLDMIVILYETGLRVSEFCGLTVGDIDFERNRLRVDHQLKYNAKEKYHVQEPKTASGNRVIPLSPMARKSLMNVVQRRPVALESKCIDGYRDFLFLSRRGNPRVAEDIEASLRQIVKSYNELHEEKLPKITPHVFRHTFCTRLILAGIDIKSVQYLMGHSTIKTTLEVYAHVNADAAIESFEKLMNAAV